MDPLANLRAKYPDLPSEYFLLVGELGGWEGFVGDRYVALFDAATAHSATDDYQIPEFRPGFFALGSDGGGEIIVCSLTGNSDRSVSFLPAIGMSDGSLIEVAPSFRDFRESLLAAARGGDA